MVEKSDFFLNWLFNFKNGHKMTHRAFVKQSVMVFFDLLTVVILSFIFCGAGPCPYGLAIGKTIQGILVIGIINNNGFEALTHL